MPGGAAWAADTDEHRPRRSAVRALGVCRQRCGKQNWVTDLDIQKFFDAVDHALMAPAVGARPCPIGDNLTVPPPAWST